MTPIKPGTYSRLGLRKPTGVYRYKDGAIRDEIRIGSFGVTFDQLVTPEQVKNFAEACGVSLQDWQANWVARNSPGLGR